MSTTYKAVFGFGVVLGNVEEIEEKINDGELSQYDSLEEFLEDVEAQSMSAVPEGFNLKTTRTWDGCETYYMTLNNPFEDGFSGVKQKVRELYQYLRSWDLDWLGDADVVGGLDVC